MIFLKVIIALGALSIIDARRFISDLFICGNHTSFKVFRGRMHISEVPFIQFHEYKDDAAYALLCYDNESNFKAARYYLNYPENCTINQDEFANDTLAIQMIVKCDKTSYRRNNFEDLTEYFLETQNNLKISDALAQGNWKKLNKYIENAAKQKPWPVRVINGIIGSNSDSFSNITDPEYLYKIVTLSPNRVTAYIAINGVEDKEPICNIVIPDCGWLDASKGKIYCCELDDDLIEALELTTEFI